MLRDHRGYVYEYDMENRLTTVRRSDTTLVATFAYDALGRRIEKVDAIAGMTTRYYYDEQRVAVQTQVAGGVETDDRYFVFGNTIDEVLVMHDGTGDLYYAHDHLYSPVALFAANGTVAERYEYDAYGKVQILNSQFLILNSSQYANPYAFTGRELDTLDAGSRTLMYYRARTYDPETGRFMQRDPLMYADGVNLYQYVESQVMIAVDPLGLFLLPIIVIPPNTGFPDRGAGSRTDDCCKLEEWPTPGDDYYWNYILARLHFYYGKGQTKEFPAGSSFSNYVKNNLSGLVSTKRDTVKGGLDEVMRHYAEAISPTECRRFGLGGSFDRYAWHSGSASAFFPGLAGTIGSGNSGEKDFSDLLYNADCCWKKDCCIPGGVTKVSVKCKVQITLKDLYGYHYYPDQQESGTNFWTVVHWFQDYKQEFIIQCK